MAGCHLTVITNGLRIASELAGIPGITVAMPGGFVRWEALSVVGPLGDGLFRKVNVQKAFLGAAGFSLESGLSDATEEEAQIKRSMADAAREVIGIVDQHEVGARGVRDVLPAVDLSAVITDGEAPAATVADLRSRGIDVHLAGAREDGALADAVAGRPMTIAEPPADAPPRARIAERRLEAVRGDPGARRRLARPAGPARSTPSSGRTARARAPSSRSSPASTSRTPATIVSTASRSCSTGRRRPATLASPSSTRSRASSPT